MSSQQLQKGGRLAKRCSSLIIDGLELIGHGFYPAGRRTKLYIWPSVFEFERGFTAHLAASAASGDHLAGGFEMQKKTAHGVATVSG